MKVLYVSGMYPTPAYPQKGVFCHSQVKALMKQGIDVTVVVPLTFYDREVKVKEWDFEGVHIRYIRFFKLPGTMDFHKMGNSLFRRLDKKLDLSQFDVYHADAPLPVGTALMKASEKYGKPFVVHGHGLDVYFDKSYEGAKNCAKIVEACRLVYEKANAVIGVSQKVLDMVQARVDVSKKGHVIYNGVDTDVFVPIEKEKTDEFIISSVGNLIPLKGHKYLIQAVQRAVEKGYENIRCVIAGRGYLEEELKELTADLGLQDYVQFLGYVPYEEVVKLLQSSNAFILPSYYEAIGCVYLEAMACGVPSVGCRENGIDEIIVDGENGYLVDNHNVEQIVDCIVALQDEQKHIEMRKAARKTVVENYTWKHAADILISIYEKVVTGK